MTDFLHKPAGHDRGVEATGLVLAWMVFDWLGNPWDHCDYPEECGGTWFPRAFQLIQYAWAATVLLATAGLVAAATVRRPRVELAVLSIAWVLLFTALAVTPLYGGGQPPTLQQMEGNAFLWDDASLGYRAVGMALAVAAVLFGWQAIAAALHDPHDMLEVILESESEDEAQVEATLRARHGFDEVQSRAVVANLSPGATRARRRQLAERHQELRHRLDELT